VASYKKLVFGKHLFLILFSLIMIYPLLWLFLSSLKPNDEIFSTIKLIPTQWLWKNYAIGWKAIPGYHFGVFFLNTFKVVGLIMFGNVLSTTMAAYSFARLRFPMKGILFAVLMGTLMFPQQILLIPRYVLFSRFGWTNSYAPLIVPAFAAQVSGAFFVFLMVQFMRGIPKELDEAAIVDGCGFFRVFWNILLPNCTPAIFTIGLFSFMWAWNDFLNQLIYINDVGDFTISLALRLFLDNAAAVNWGPLFAMSILSLFPLLVLFFGAQRFFVEGIATTGVKG
jgi:multiple sugar transport system permease protein